MESDDDRERIERLEAIEHGEVDWDDAYATALVVASPGRRSTTWRKRLRRRAPGRFLRDGGLVCVRAIKNRKTPAALGFRRLPVQVLPRARARYLS